VNDLRNAGIYVPLKGAPHTGSMLQKLIVRHDTGWLLGCRGYPRRVPPAGVVTVVIEVPHVWFVTNTGLVYTMSCVVDMKQHTRRQKMSVLFKRGHADGTSRALDIPVATLAGAITQKSQVFFHQTF
jgi:hypothetical protein